MTRSLPWGDFVDRLQSFSFHHLCYPNYGALTSTPAGLSPAEHASLRWTHNRTCGFPASGFPTGFTARHTAARRVRCVLRKQRARADAPSNTDRRPSSPRGKASSEASGHAGVFQAHRQSPILGSVQSAPEARALSSASITRPPRSYGPLRLPSDPPPMRRGGCQPQSGRVSPDDPHHLSSVPCPVPRRIETGACVDCFPAHTAFPVSQAGRHPHLHFRDAMGRTVGRCHHRRWKQRDGASHGTAARRFE